MSQTIWSSIVPSTTSGNQLATYLNDFKEAMVSGMSGTARPTELDAGGMWVDTTSDPIWYLKIFDGTSDITMLTINTTTNVASVSEAADTYTISKTSADVNPPVLSLLKKRIANSGQVLDGDYVGQIEVKGNNDSGSAPVTVRFRVQATDNFTTSSYGSDFMIETTEDASTSLTEKIRIKGSGKVGLGITSPDEIIHAVGNVKVEKQGDNTSPSEFISRKKRDTGAGQVLSGDVITRVIGKSTNDAGTEIDAAKIEYSATENHTASAQGSKVSISIKKTGATSFTEKLVLADNVEIKENLVLEQQVDSTTTGADQAVTITKPIFKVTNAGLTSINNIVIPSGAIAMLINGLSTDLVIKNNAGGTAANRIITGTGDDLTMATGSTIFLAYDADSSRNRIVGGSGSGGGTYYTNTTQSVSGGGTITVLTNKVRQLCYVAGNAGAQVTSSTPFGTSALVDGAEVEVIGTDDTNTIEIPFADSAKGCVGNFSSITLAKYEKARFVYSLSLDRFIGGKL